MPRTSPYWRLDSISKTGRKLKVPKKVRRFMQRHIRHHIKDYGMTQKQAIAVAYQEARVKYGIKLPGR